MLSLFRQYAIPHQIILSKVDRILAQKLRKGLSHFTDVQRKINRSKLNNLKKIMEDMKPIIQPIGPNEGPGSLGEILSCTTVAKQTLPTGNCLGISSIRWSILQATGLVPGHHSEAVKVSPSSDVRAKDPATSTSPVSVHKTEKIF